MIAAKTKQQNQARKEQSNSIKGSHKILKEAGKQFVLNLLETLKTHMTDQKVMIDKLIDFLHYKVGPIQVKKGTTNKQEVAGIWTRLQETAEDLNKTSDQLCERLFDLSQQVVQADLINQKTEAQKIKEVYSAECTQLRRIFSEQKRKLTSQLQTYKQKYFALEEYAKHQEKHFSSQQQKDWRKRQLLKYLQAIDEIWSELQLIRQESKTNLCYTDDSLQQSETQIPSAKNFSDHYSYDRRMRKKINGSRDTIHQYYPEEINQKETVYTERQTPRTIALDIRSNYVRVPSKDKQLYHNNRIVEPPSYKAMILSQRQQGYNDRGLHRPKSTESRYNYCLLNRNSSNKMDYLGMLPGRPAGQQMKRMEQKNQRMQTIEGKLQGLKRKLERQVRSMML